ncbi:MAG: hypothetical protein ACYTG0_39925, partial [Planctomycetota bacterium]
MVDSCAPRPARKTPSHDRSGAAVVPIFAPPFTRRLRDLPPWLASMIIHLGILALLGSLYLSI